MYILCVYMYVCVCVCVHTYMYMTPTHARTYRVRLYTAMLQQEIGFFDANSKGQLMSMMGEDVSRMQQAVTDNITSIIQQIATIVQCGRCVCVYVSPDTC
jgi:ABC-type multidrug transport system fused ATPase/permease subunit